MDFLNKCFQKKPENRMKIEDILNHPWFTGPVEKLEVYLKIIFF